MNYREWFEQQTDFKEYEHSGMKAVYDNMLKMFKNKLEQAFNAGYAEGAKGSAKTTDKKQERRI